MRSACAGFRDDRGFTLIELMVVVLIIGILAAIAVPTFLGAQDSAKDTAAKATLRNAYTTAKVFQSAHGGSYVDPVSSLPFDASQGAILEPSLPWANIAVTASSTTIHMEMLSESGKTCFLDADDTSGVLTLDCP